MYQTFIAILELVQLLWLLSIFVDILIVFPESKLCLTILGVCATFIRLISDCIVDNAAGETKNEPDRHGAEKMV